MIELEWNECSLNGLTILMSRDDKRAVGDALFQVYECMDGSWRVWFKHGLATKELDVKVRNLPDRNAAIDRANAWWREWALVVA